MDTVNQMWQTTFFHKMINSSTFLHNVAMPVLFLHNSLHLSKDQDGTDASKTSLMLYQFPFALSPPQAFPFKTEMKQFLRKPGIWFRSINHSFLYSFCTCQWTHLTRDTQVHKSYLKFVNPANEEISFWQTDDLRSPYIFTQLGQRQQMNFPALLLWATFIYLLWWCSLQ